MQIHRVPYNILDNHFHMSLIVINGVPLDTYNLKQMSNGKELDKSWFYKSFVQGSLKKAVLKILFGQHLSEEIVHNDQKASLIFYLFDL